MKILTKPVKSRLPSPCIYGYEDGAAWFYDGQSIVEYGDPPEVTWYTTYLKCKSYGESPFCTAGDSFSITNTVYH